MYIPHATAFFIRTPPALCTWEFLPIPLLLGSSLRTRPLSQKVLSLLPSLQCPLHVRNALQVAGFVPRSALIHPHVTGSSGQKGLFCWSHRLGHLLSPAVLADASLIHRSVPGQWRLPCQWQCPGTESSVHHPSTLPPQEDLGPFRFSAALLLLSRLLGGKQIANYASDHFKSSL